LKAFVATYDRPTLATTPKFLGAFDWYFLIHNQNQKEKYVASAWDPDKILVTGTEPGELGAAKQHHYAYEHLVEEGEWFLLLDDDITEILRVNEHHYAEEFLDVTDKSKNWNEIYSGLVDDSILEYLVWDTIQKAERESINYCGFSPMGNPFFRSKKWMYKSPLTNGFRIWRKTPGYPTDYLTHMEDICKAAEHIYRDGKILMNNWVHVRNDIYKMAGGFQSTPNRLAQKARSRQELLARYTWLLKEHEFKAGKEVPGVTIRKLGDKNITKWRKETAEQRGEPFPRLRLQAICVETIKYRDSSNGLDA
jgi:hypothetical protein